MRLVNVQALQGLWEPSRFTYGLSNVVAESQPPSKRLRTSDTQVCNQSIRKLHWKPHMVTEQCRFYCRRHRTARASMVTKATWSIVRMAVVWDLELRMTRVSLEAYLPVQPGAR